MTEEQQPPALPPAGGSTSSRFDPRTPDLSGENLSLEEASSLFRVSERTLRRQLSAGKIAGAVQRGRRWLIPRVSLMGLYELKEPEGEPPTPSNEPEPEVLELLSQLLGRESKVQAQLEAKTGQLEAMTERLLESEVRAARAEEQARALTLELETLKQRRRWLRRSPKA
jgi:excisionase family DNA binding protein